MALPSHQDILKQLSSGGPKTPTVPYSSTSGIPSHQDIKSALGGGTATLKRPVLSSTKKAEPKVEEKKKPLSFNGISFSEKAQSIIDANSKSQSTVEKKPSLFSRIKDDTKAFLRGDVSAKDVVKEIPGTVKRGTGTVLKTLFPGNREILNQIQEEKQQTLIPEEGRRAVTEEQFKYGIIPAPRITNLFKNATEAEQYQEFLDTPIIDVTSFAGALERVTAKTLERMAGRKVVSRKFIEDLIKMPDIKQSERNLFTNLLKEEGNKINVEEFSKKASSELLPLKRVQPEGDIPLDAGEDFAGPTPRYENVTLPEKLRGRVENYSEHVYESPIKTTAGDVHFSDEGFKNYFAHTRVEDLPTDGTFGGTRRIIEVQSDLFQKGRLEGSIPQGITREASQVNREIAQLEPYRNTWWERVVREETQQAIEDGKSILQFPTGETAMKIEGLGDTHDFHIPRIIQGDEVPGRFLDDSTLKVGQKIYRGGYVGADEWIITEVLEDGKFKAVTKNVYDDWVREGRSPQYIQQYAEQFDISGKIDTENPIYKFYEKDVGRYLKNKYNAVRVTDEQGVPWYQVDLTKVNRGPVEAFGVVAGIEKDEEGNITFDPVKAAAGVVAIGSVNRFNQSGKNVKRAISDLTEDINSYELQRDLLRDAIENNPARKLSKFANKRTGELPEVTGGATGRFAREGDAIVDTTEFGSFAHSETAREAFQKYQQDKARFDGIKNIIKSLRDDLKELKLVEKDQKAMDRFMDRVNKLDETQFSRQERLQQIKKAADEGAARVKAEAERLEKLRSQRILSKRAGTEIETLRDQLKRSMAPFKHTDTATRESFRDWETRRLLAKEAGNLQFEYTRDLLGIPKEAGMDVIGQYEKGQKTPYSDKIKKVFDDLYEEANKEGANPKYRENYIPHAYDNSPQEIIDAATSFLMDNGLKKQEALDYVMGLAQLPNEVSQRLRLTPKFEKTRFFKDYDTAIQYGLKPRFKTIEQLAGYYKEELMKTIANKKFFNELEGMSKILPADEAPRHWEFIDATFTPQAYKAPKQTADAINGIFRNGLTRLYARIVNVGARMSKGMQELALSAGLPKTTVNFFAIGQVIKEITAGNWQAIPTFLRSNFDARSLEFFRENAEILDKMAKQNIDLSGRIGNFDDAYETLKDMDGLWDKVGFVFDKAFNEKTFRSFMPQLWLGEFKRYYNKGIKMGMEEAKAQAFAADVVRKGFGITEQFGRSKTTRDTLSSVFFAPVFRESVLNTLLNTGRAGVDVLAAMGGLRRGLTPEYAKGRRLLAGAIFTYGLYNVANKKLNGYYMWENPDNRKNALRIPMEDGSVMYFEFLPSFLATARNLYNGTLAFAKGDVREAQQKFGSLFSMPIKITTEIIGNSDYFGREIYNDEDTWPTKAGKIATYMGLQVNHPYVKEVVKFLQTKKDERQPIWQHVSVGLELPLKYSSELKESRSEFYKAMDKQQKERARENDSIRPILEEAYELNKEGKTTELKQLIDGLSDEEYAAYKRLLPSYKASQTKRRKSELYKFTKNIQKLVSEGKQSEAKALVDQLSDEDYRIYKLVVEDIKKETK